MAIGIILSMLWHFQEPQVAIRSHLLILVWPNALGAVGLFLRLGVFIQTRQDEQCLSADLSETTSFGLVVKVVESGCISYSPDGC